MFATTYHQMRATAMSWLATAAEVEPRNPALAKYYRAQASKWFRRAARKLKEDQQ